MPPRSDRRHATASDHAKVCPRPVRHCAPGRALLAWLLTAAAFTTAQAQGSVQPPVHLTPPGAQQERSGRYAQDDSRRRSSEAAENDSRGRGYEESESDARRRTSEAAQNDSRGRTYAVDEKDPRYPRTPATRPAEPSRRAPMYPAGQAPPSRKPASPPPAAKAPPRPDYRYREDQYESQRREEFEAQRYESQRREQAEADRYQSQRSDDDDRAIEQQRRDEAEQRQTQRAPLRDPRAPQRGEGDPRYDPQQRPASRYGGEPPRPPQHRRPPGYVENQPEDHRDAGAASRGSAAGLQPRCGNPVGVEVFTFPERPVPGLPVRAVAVSERDFDGELFLVSPDGERVAASRDRNGGPPYWWYIEAMPRMTGRYRAVLATGGSTACADADVSDNPSPLPEPPSSAVWPVQRRWDRAMENLYSAWVEKLFDDPLDASPSWDSLHEITREPDRNFLFEYLGLGEDSSDGLTLEPDCADLPYFLRGYFAWKMRLPFGYSKCHRVAAGQPPTCSEWTSNLKASPPGGELSRVQKFLARDVGWGVHSGTDRTLGDDDKSDVYPTRLTAQTLRPGAVFADPYGHILILVQRIPQTPTASGQFLAVDAQPDGTVARKQFWRGTFLFAIDPKLGGAGFKNFRPILPVDGELRMLTNAEILEHPDYGDFSMEQYERGVDAFYDRMDEVLSPEPRDAEQVVREIVDSLEQQVRGRVDSVQNGEDYMKKNPATVSMPKGAGIFQTVGAWEDYATPSRDLRLLIAIDVVRGFPDRVARQPRRYRLPEGGGDVRRRLQSLLEEETRRRTFEYTRSNGTSQTLHLSDVLERVVDLEMAYNPNDCVEIRWGAKEGSPERSTCKRQAPQEQRRRMNHQFRDWFRERRRPST